MPNQTDSNNSAALDAVAALINNLDPIIARYDDLTQQKPKLDANLTASQELEKKTLNDESLSHENLDGERRLPSSDPEKASL